MGIEAVKSSTPAPCREKIKQALKIIMSSDEKELNDFIQDFRTEFMEMKPELIAYPRSVNGLNKWTESTTTVQERSSYSLQRSYSLQSPIEKI
jgi:hypothetical protein